MHPRGQMRFTGDYYHVWNRGARAGALFIDEEDYRRFLILLALGNRREPLDTRTLRKRYGGHLSLEILRESVARDFVDIAAYCLLKDGFHMIVREKKVGGVEQFMRKVCTAYSMYFNTKYRHDGTLFRGRYKSRRIGVDSHLRYVFARVHLEALALVEPRWKDVEVADKKTMRMFIATYPYSSYRDYQQAETRTQGALIAPDDRLSHALQGKADIISLFSYLQSDVSSGKTKDRPSYKKQGITS